MQLVLDASAATRMVLGHPGVDPSSLDRLEHAEEVLAPRLFMAEVANAFWKYVRAGSLTERDALQYLTEARALVTLFVDDAEFVHEALSAAARYEHSVYDALYAVVARRNSWPVLTVDDRLRKLLAAMRVDSV